MIVAVASGKGGTGKTSVVNKADLKPARSDEIAAFCTGQEVEVAGQILYDMTVTEAMVAG